jgi:hypothetical protein
VHDQLDLRYSVAMAGYMCVLAVTRFSLGG